MLRTLGLTSMNERDHDHTWLEESVCMEVGQCAQSLTTSH